MMERLVTLGVLQYSTPVIVDFFHFDTNYFTLSHSAGERICAAQMSRRCSSGAIELDGTQQAFHAPNTVLAESCSTMVHSKAGHGPCNGHSNGNAGASRMDIERAHFTGPSNVRKLTPAASLESKRDRCPRVLVVDDDPDSLALLRLFLAAKGFEVRTTDSSKTACKYVWACWPDLIVTDFDMPELSGLDLCRLVRSDARTCHIPIVVQTAYDELPSDQGSLYDGLFHKPVEFNQFVRTLHRLLTSDPARKAQRVC